MDAPGPLDALAEQLEAASVLDSVAAPVQHWLRKLIPEGPVDDALRGKPLGHPLHPGLVAIPIGAWSCAPMLDLIGDADGARRLTAIGCLAALPAALSGGAEWLATDGAQRRVGLVHAAVNDAALIANTMSWLARRRGNRWRGFRLSLVGAGLFTVGGWLGGHLAYSQGVGVDITRYLRRQAPAS